MIDRLALPSRQEVAGKTKTRLMYRKDARMLEKGIKAGGKIW